MMQHKEHDRPTTKTDDCQIDANVFERVLASPPIHPPKQHMCSRTSLSIIRSVHTSAPCALEHTLEETVSSSSWDAVPDLLLTTNWHILVLVTATQAVAKKRMNEHAR